MGDLHFLAQMQSQQGSCFILKAENHHVPTFQFLTSHDRDWNYILPIQFRCFDLLTYDAANSKRIAQLRQTFSLTLFETQLTEFVACVTCLNF